MSPRVRVLIVDDSPSVRATYGAWLASQPDLEVVGMAEDGRRAVELAEQLAPDVITMDLEMPVMDGFEAIAAIMSHCPARILAVCTLGDEQARSASHRLLAAGALEVLQKPRPGTTVDGFRARLVEAVRLMAEVPVVRRRGFPSPLMPRPPHAIAAAGVVSSAGGPPALAVLLNRLGQEFPVPLLVAQHITTGFTEGMAKWLQRSTPMPVRIAANGEKLQGGTIYFAPDGSDLWVEAPGVIRVAPAEHDFTPCGDRLLESLALAFGERAAGVVLSGMGEDGSSGLRAIWDAGGATYAQNEATSVVFGMPSAAYRRGAVANLLPPTEIASRLQRLATPERFEECLK